MADKLSREMVLVVELDKTKADRLMNQFCNARRAMNPPLIVAKCTKSHIFQKETHRLLVSGRPIANRILRDAVDLLQP